MNKLRKITTGQIYKLIQTYKYKVLCDKCKNDKCDNTNCLLDRNYDKNMARYIVRRLR